MFTTQKEQQGCVIAGLVDVKRFNLAITEDVKSELKPLLSQKGTKLILSLENIEFVDSSGIGCIISLVKAARNYGSGIKICSMTKEVVDIFELLHLQMILDIEENVESAIKSFNK